jgi:acylphosphatase
MPYSYHTQKKATEYSLTGWVGNVAGEKVRTVDIPSDSVTLGDAMLTKHQIEGEAQGEEGPIKNFVKYINAGPKEAHVVKVETNEIPPVEGEKEFEIRRIPQ